MDPAAPARRAALRHAHRKELPAVTKNRNYPQPVKHPKPTALAHVPLGNTYGVAVLLQPARGGRARARDRAGRPSSRPHPLDDRCLIALLLGELRKAGAEQQTNAVTARLSAAGLFRFFVE